MEFVIKVIADGFIFTPNVYVWSIWNVLDFFIMAGLLVNVMTSLIFIGSLSRFTRALKALRALKLVMLIEKMRSTFELQIISSITHILDAVLLTLLYVILYVVWGLNIFTGLTNWCNDGMSGLTSCTNKYNMSFVDSGAFMYPMPRVWANLSPLTAFSFDSFHMSFLILFEIVSLEGWVDVMGITTSITRPGLQPQTDMLQVNTIFFLIYNLLGVVVILTLFVR